MHLLQWFGVLASLVFLQIAPAHATGETTTPPGGAAAKAEGIDSQPEIPQTPEDRAYDFMAGSYTVIGKTSSGEAYVGTLILLRQGGRMAVVRRIINQEDRFGTAHVEDPTQPSPMLMVEYESQGKSRAQDMKYLITADTDSKPLLIGNIRSKGNIPTGHEVLFFDHQPGNNEATGREAR